jgi:hypothetical protein
MVEFDTVWSDLQISLKPGGEIKNWNAYNGYLGDNLRINEVNPNYLSIDPPRVWGTQVIPRVDFEHIWNIWLDYRELRVKRDELREFTNQSKYIISIFRWYETER